MRDRVYFQLMIVKMSQTQDKNMFAISNKMFLYSPHQVTHNQWLI